jgi:3-hydroxybutyryl-CoA dehydrogenase
MPAPSPRSITVVGAGFMGAVIATLYARYGYRVRVTDSMAQPLETFRERARPIAESLAHDGTDAATLLAAVQAHASLEEAVAGSFFVHEVIHEDLAAKQALFSTLDHICPPEVVLGTNTSSLKLSEIFKRVRHRDRVIGVHYITPAHIVRLVEIIKADFTPPALVQWARDFLMTIDRVGVVCTDTPGFLVNRLQYALVSEAYRIVEQEIASRDDVDNAFRLALGPRLALWGPLLTEDLVVSKKTCAAVWGYLHEKTGDEKFRRPAAVSTLVDAGKLGAISGAGWYRFDRDYASIVSSRDSQLRSLLEWLAEHDRLAELKVS